MQKTKKIIIILFCICIITASFSGCLSRPETLEETADKMYSSYLQSEGVPSASVLVVKDGEKLLEKSYGLRNIKAGERATPNSSYRLACVTKPFTSMGILLLWEKGLIDLDMPVKEILTDFHSPQKGNHTPSAAEFVRIA
jgi:CubicO group peptidase (beta-lactamase class C family)